jgi:transposase
VACAACGRENVHKRYLDHVAGHNLGVLIRALFGVGTPKEAAAIRNAFTFLIQTAETTVIMIVVRFDADMAALNIAAALET